jgi:alpha-mannosidase
MRQSGIHRFLTQKLSWNRYNKPEHHTFTWRGVDGSEVLAHFPPNDNYNSEPDVKSLRFNVTNHKDHDRNAHSYMLFGYGDGGGGPTREMLERIARAGDLQGLPRTHMRSAEQFFDLLENAVSDRPMIVGELYFEYHRGTYTTQADTKRNNRKAEWLLHDLELLAALADRVIGRADYPRQAIDDAWKLVLLNQFHDILPGSSIGEVYHDASEDYQRVFEICEPLAQQAGERLAAALASPPSQGGAGGGSPVPDANGPSPLNTLGVPRRELMTTPTGDLVPVEAPAMGFGMVVDAPAPVRLQRSGEAYVLSNEHLTATVQPDGTISHLAEVGAPGEAVIDGRAHVLELFDDRPTAYDAWDIDPFALETRREAPPAHTCEVMREDSLRVELRYERDLGQGSTMTQVVRLDAGSRRLEVDCEVDWHASHTLLKVAFPTTIQARNTTCEMQWHTVDRPTHRNTSFDQAMFEVPAHRWVDLSQPGLGVALLSESKYGFSFEDQTIKMTLLRSPKSPDPDADMGRHQFSYALMPHAGDWRAADVTGEGLRFNQPMRWIDHAPANVSLASVDHPALVLDTIKKAEETEATVLRLYESYGTRGEATVKLNVPFESAVRCNFLEDDGDAVDVTDGSLRVSFEPWQVISIKVR